MRRIIGFFVILLLFTNCEKKIEQNTIEKTISSDNKIIEDISEMNIEFISINISNDFKSKWNYKNFTDLIDALNISSNFLINKNTGKDLLGDREGDVMDVYEIESNDYKFIIWRFPEYSDNYSLMAIEIKINENNYLDLFPYRDYENYLNDNNFGIIFKYKDEDEKRLNNSHGKIWRFDRDSGYDYINYDLRWGITKLDDYMGIGTSQLIFLNGVLDSIKIISSP